MKTITVDGRSVVLDIEEPTAKQGQILAETLAKVLTKIGGIAEGAHLTGPALLLHAEDYLEQG